MDLKLGLDAVAKKGNLLCSCRESSLSPNLSLVPILTELSWYISR